MSLMAKEPENSQSFPLIEAGTHHAVCYSVVDIGTHHSDKFNTDAHQVVITWELPKVRIEIDKDGAKQDLPRAISKTYTLSLHEKANLCKDLVAWRGKPFTEQERQGFDILNLIKANCLLQIVHNQKDDKTFANIAAVAKLMKGMKKYNPENPTVGFSMIEDGIEPPEKIPDWIKDMIKKSMEYRAVHSAQGNTDLQAAQDQYIPEDTSEAPFPESNPYVPGDDDIPF